MGVYDYLKAPCPSCGKIIGKDSGDMQIKWFSTLELGECFRTFQVGDALPVILDNGIYLVNERGYPFCCGVKRPLYAVIEHGVFKGFSYKR